MAKNDMNQSMQPMYKMRQQNYNGPIATPNQGFQYGGPTFQERGPVGGMIGNFAGNQWTPNMGLAGNQWGQILDQYLNRPMMTSMFGL